MKTIPHRRSGSARAVLALAGACRATMILAAPAAIGIFPAGAAYAEFVASEPYYVVVTGDEVNIRCGAGSVWYPVATVPAGTVLKVDGADQGWLRVAYPEGAGAMVRASDVTVSGGSVTLTQPSRLLANNPKGGLSESWRPLLDQELAAGTTLRVLEEVRDGSGEVSGFRVAAPSDARGFVSERSVRPATEAEAAPLRGPMPKPVETAAAPETSGAPAAQPQTTPPAETPPAEATPAAPVELTPVVTPVETRPEPAPAQRAVGTLNQLNAAFEALKRVPTEDAEIQPLISEYTRFMSSLSDSAADSGFRRYAESRVELLRARLELQSQLLAVKEAEAFAARGFDQITQSVRQMQANPLYKVVGRLGASTVYNGQNLPQMFRVQSVEGGVGRTLAYVLPTDGVDLAGKIGFIVGVVGDSRTDVVLGLPIIEPKRVDLLTTVQGTGPSEGQ
ncbi:MAG: hypothetical protein IBJ10_07925 [Phycisphaerales bacterium]|nr:hypothetical protein [Phycisphaerales bacterium]